MAAVAALWWVRSWPGAHLDGATPGYFYLYSPALAAILTDSFRVCFALDSLGRKDCDNNHWQGENQPEHWLQPPTDKQPI